MSGRRRNWFDQQSNYDAPSFSGEYVVGSTGCGCIHGLQADARVNEWAQPFMPGKAEPFAASEYDEFWRSLSQCGKVIFCEMVELVAIPGGALATGVQHQAVHDPFAAYRNPSGAIAADGRGAYEVGLKFHGFGAFMVICGQIVGFPQQEACRLRVTWTRKWVSAADLQRGIRRNEGFWCAVLCRIALDRGSEED